MCCEGASFREYSDAAAFARDLREMADRLPVEPPGEWRVHTGQGLYSIATAPLKEAPDARAWLEHLAEQVEGFDGGRAGGPVVGAQLRAILAQREFAGARPPNALERLWLRIRKAIWEWLDARFRFGEMPPITGILIFGGVLALALGILVAVLRRERESYLLGLKAGGLGLSVRNWEEWTRAAREAADSGDARKAILCAYWAGISRLQASGDLPSDMAKTPREYLRLLGAKGSAAPALRALTVQLEAFWYGPGRATAADVSACFEALKDVGCQVP
jgi:hypothetical protein